ncbi:MAG: 50S ribosomal protein L9 [Planctomycetota bacterium]|nr:50S ribosomal protein L9 [Planctomycetota bacterium]
MANKVEILLREHIKYLGRCGDVVKVNAGFARNYLLPRKLAVGANDENKKAMMRRRAILDVEESKRNAEIEARVASLNGIMVMTKVKADEAGHLYGSVNAGTIVVLLERAGHRYDEKAVRIDAPIKTTGTHAIKVHVHGDYFAEVKVVVEAETV